ncbi:MAG: chemotaxis protein CheW [Pseudomonadales bacterium]
MAEIDALSQLRDIESAVFRHALPLPLQADARPAWQGTGFQVGGLRLVAAMGEVGEVLKLPKVAPLPGVKSWVVGVANVRGRLIPVIDLHDFLGLRPTQPNSQWRVLVVEDRELVAGLLVEQSLGIQHFLEETFGEVPADAPESLAPYLRGAFRHGGRIYYDLELPSILRDEKFRDVAHGVN